MDSEDENIVTRDPLEAVEHTINNENIPCTVELALPVCDVNDTKGKVN